MNDGQKMICADEVVGGDECFTKASTFSSAFVAVANKFELKWLRIYN